MRRLALMLVPLALLALACSDSDDDDASTAALPVAAVGDEGAATVAGGIAVQGVGEVRGAPDTMTVTLGVQVTADTVAGAIDQANRAAEAVLSALAEDGVAAEDIATQGLSVYPQYDYRPDGEQRLLGYQVTNTLMVTIRDLDRAGEIIDDAVAAGGDATIVQGVGFSVEDDTERLAEARERAWADARARAEQLAELADVTLGAPLSIQEGVLDAPVPFDARVEAADMAGGVPIQPGQVTSTVTLTVRFAIES